MKYPAVKKILPLPEKRPLIPNYSMLQLYLQSCIFSTERTKGQLCMWQETKSWLRAEYGFSPFQLWLCQSGANIVHRFCTVENLCQASWLFIAIYCSREFIYFFSLWWLFINGIVSQDRGLQRINGWVPGIPLKV